MAVIGINYSGSDHDYDKEGNRIELTPSTLKYESVYIHWDDNEKIFDSGNFVKDWFDAKLKYNLDLQDSEPFLSSSSSCDHFFMDGADFDSAYLHIEGSKPILKYLNREVPDWYLSKDGDGWEFFVPTGTKPTWEELKEMCKTTMKLLPEISKGDLERGYELEDCLNAFENDGYYDTHDLDTIEENETEYREELKLLREKYSLSEEESFTSLKYS